jgi:DNA-binding MarR family transcriptional regulator
LNYLSVLELSSKGVGITRTAEALGISRVAVSLCLNHLEYAGLLTKNRATSGDRRETVVVMTPEGIRMLEGLESLFARLEPVAEAP